MQLYLLHLIIYEGRDNLFVRCEFFEKLWLLVVSWFGFSTTTHDTLKNHLIQFGGLSGFSMWT